MTSYDNIIFMKYGVHASEDVESIISRKLYEIHNAGYMLWGYGGTLCHPQTQVKELLDTSNNNLYLLLSETPSKNHSPSVRQTKLSHDKIKWDSIPPEINVLGSKYALMCDSLEPVNIHIDLSRYTVAVGSSKGKVLSDYIRGRVDKACGTLRANMSESSNLCSNNLVHISWVAHVIDAVFVRGD